jgi:hypothetical protein
MIDNRPTHTPFDRTAATILGSMISLIAALSFVLLETSVTSEDPHVPMAASAPKPRALP